MYWISCCPCADQIFPKFLAVWAVGILVFTKVDRRVCRAVTLSVHVGNSQRYEQSWWQDKKQQHLQFIFPSVPLQFKGILNVLESLLGTIHYLHVKRDKLVWFKTKLQIARKSEIIGKFPQHVGLTLDHTRTGNRITRSGKTGSRLVTNLYTSPLITGCNERRNVRCATAQPSGFPSDI